MKKLGKPIHILELESGTVAASAVSDDVISINQKTAGNGYLSFTLKKSWIKKLYDHFCQEN